MKQIEVVNVFPNPGNRYESIMLVSCGHWFVLKSGDAHQVGAKFDRAQCGRCAAVDGLSDRIVQLEAGARVLRERLSHGAS